MVVDSFITKLKRKQSQPEDPFVEQQLRLLEKLFPEEAMMDCAVVNKKVIYAFGGKDRRQRLAALIKKIKSGDLGSPPANPAEFAIDLVELEKWIISLQGKEVPSEWKEKAKPIAGYIRFGDRAVKSRISFPLSTLSKIFVTAIETAPVKPIPLAPSKKERRRARF